METKTIQKNEWRQKNHKICGKFLMFGVFFLVFCSFTNKAVGQIYSGGSGTVADPYLISSKADMEALSTAVNAGNGYSGKYFLLTRDITDGITTIIGSNSAYPFRGIFDGGGHEVNVNINTTTILCVGIFGSVSNATIINLGVAGNINAVYNVDKNEVDAGGICGYVIASTTISNCYNKGNILLSAGLCAGTTGGICGWADKATSITNCYNTGNISATAGNAASGGICGDATSTIADCYNTGYISASSATSYVGGICGLGSVITDCYNAGNISSKGGAVVYSYAFAGGICGFVSKPFIFNCFAVNTSIESFLFFSAAVVGGGWYYYDSVDLNRIAAASSGSGYIQNCYALTTMQLNGTTDYNALGNCGMDEDFTNFQSQSWIKENLGWDFDKTWEMSNINSILNGLPTLKKQENTGITSINNPKLEEKKNILVYPNPAKDELFIKSDSQIKKIEIYSSSGALQLSDNNFNGKISISNLFQGIYMVKIYTDNGLVIKKVVKE